MDGEQSESKQTLYNVCTYFQDNSFQKNREIAKKSSLGYAVMIVNLNGIINIGTIIRTSVVMGASKVFMVGKRHWDRRMSVGTHHYIDIDRFNGYLENLDLKQELSNYSPICIEQGGECLDDVNWSPYIRGDNKPPCFIMGAEDVGLSRDFINECRTFPGYRCISIPQHGIARSLNVATAHSIILYHYTAQVRVQIKNKYSID